MGTNAMLGISQFQIVEAFAPIDTTGAGQSGNYIKMGLWRRCTIVINTGAWAGGDAACTLTEATAQAGTGAQALGFSFMYTNSAAATTDTLVKTAVTSNTFNISVAASMYIIEVDSASMDNADSYDWLRVNTATPGANADLISATYILSAGDYAPHDAISALL